MLYAPPVSASPCCLVLYLLIILSSMSFALACCTNSPSSSLTVLRRTILLRGSSESARSCNSILLSCPRRRTARRSVYLGTILGTWFTQRLTAKASNVSRGARSRAALGKATAIATTTSLTRFDERTQLDEIDRSSLYRRRTSVRTRAAHIYLRRLRSLPLSCPPRIDRMREAFSRFLFLTFADE